jgi:hypothetical protein
VWDQGGQWMDLRIFPDDGKIPVFWIDLHSHETWIELQVLSVVAE